MSDRILCPSCSIRYTVTHSTADYLSIDIATSEISKLERAARQFDEAADRLYSAEDFVAWMLPDVTGSRAYKHREQASRQASIEETVAKQRAKRRAA